MRGYHESNLPALPEQQPKPEPVEPKRTAPVIPRSSFRTPAAPTPSVPIEPFLRTRLHKVPPMRRLRASNWNPPPLFQAYPQAVRHGHLQAWGTSAEELERAQKQQRHSKAIPNRIDDLVSAAQRASDPLDDKASIKTKGGSRRFSSITGSNSAEAAQKVVVLTMAGHLILYSAEGSADRMPEKVLQLGKNSAAFASDLIPGKHWVLHVSDSVIDDTSIPASTTQRSFFSRLRVPGSANRKVGRSFLLVCESAEEMTAWMTAIRRTIEEQGGKIRSDAVEQKEPDDRVKPEAAQPAQQSPVQRISAFTMEQSTLSSPLGSPTIVTDDWDKSIAQMREDTCEQSPTSSQRASVRYSVEASSMSTSATSHDQWRLDQLREGSRHSFMSSATSATALTSATSRNSSPSPPSSRSDTRSKSDTETLRTALALKPVNRGLASAANRRRSIQTLPVPSENNQLALTDVSWKPNRHSAYGHIGRMHLSDSPPSSTTRGSRLSPLPSPRTDLASKENVFSSTSIPPIPTRPVPPPVPPLNGAFLLSAAPIERSANRVPVLQAPPKRPTPKKLGFRPVPIRPAEMKSASRVSSLPNLPQLSRDTILTTTPGTSRSSFQSNPSTALSRSEEYIRHRRQQQPPQPQPANALRRPASMQIRSDPAPFLSSVRSNSSRLPPVPPIPGEHISAFLINTFEGRPPSRGVRQRTSMPFPMALPPPAPPPTAPLPLLPPHASLLPPGPPPEAPLPIPPISQM